MYSNALFGPEEGGPRGDKTIGTTVGQLENAQVRKLHHVLTKARVKPGDRVLEFGTGWGGMAVEVCYFCPIVVDISRSIGFFASGSPLSEIEPQHRSDSERVQAVAIS